MKADTLFATITDELIAAIEAGATDWRMPWHTLADAGTPTSIDGRPYRGLNALWLPLVAASHRWDSGRWGTYRAWQRHGARVGRAEKGTPVVLWKRLEPNHPTEPDNDPDSPTRSRLVARTFTVFAAEQVDGADPGPTSGRSDRNTSKRIDDAEALFAAVGAHVQIGGNVACYRPTTDTIHVPSLDRFDQAAHYYSTLAHEHVHWTGHPGRLDRDLSGRFGSDAYAAEELIAELGAAMWSAQAGLSAATRQDHAAYLAHWLNILRTDPRALVTVASRAQAAVDDLNRRADLNATSDPSEVAA